MAATYEPLSVPRVDRTADAALARVRDVPGRLEVSIAERVGEQLLEAFERLARAYYGRQS